MEAAPFQWGALVGAAVTHFAAPRSLPFLTNSRFCGSTLAMKADSDALSDALVPHMLAVRHSQEVESKAIFSVVTHSDAYPPEDQWWGEKRREEAVQTYKEKCVTVRHCVTVPAPGLPLGSSHVERGRGNLSAAQASDNR
jgi:hypothetical protein